METSFTPLQSLGGGALIGFAAVLLMLSLGRVMGATGILSGLILPSDRQDFSWRAAIVLGMISGPLVLVLGGAPMPEISVPVSIPMLVIGGVLVGLGVSFGGGCTSGHGVCGMARLSVRSVVATITFMIFAGATVYLTRHVWGV